MPRGDKTGPMGQGMMSGRKMGPCAGYNTPGFMGGRGFGNGFGRGGGRGCRWNGAGFGYRWNQVPVQNEKEMLKNEAEALKARLDEITKRLEENE